MGPKDMMPGHQRRMWREGSEMVAGVLCAAHVIRQRLFRTPTSLAVAPAQHLPGPHSRRRAAQASGREAPEFLTAVLSVHPRLQGGARRGGN